MWIPTLFLSCTWIIQPRIISRCVHKTSLKSLYLIIFLTIMGHSRLSAWAMFSTVLCNWLADICDKSTCFIIIIDWCVALPLITLWRICNFKVVQRQQKWMKEIMKTLNRNGHSLLLLYYLSAVSFAAIVQYV